MPYDLKFNLQQTGAENLDRVTAAVRDIGARSKESAFTLEILEKSIRADIAAGMSLEQSLKNVAGSSAQFGASIQAAAKEVLKADADIQKLGRTMDAALVENSRRAAAEVSGLSKELGNATKGFALATVGLGVIGGFGLQSGRALAEGVKDLITGYAEAARETQRFAERLGVTVTRARELENVAQLAGVNIHTLESSSRLLSNALEDSSGSGKKAADALQRIGIQSVSASGDAREMGGVLLDVIQKLSLIPDATERAREGNAILGRGFKEIEPLVNEYQDLRKELQLLGLSFDQEIITKGAEADRKFRELSLGFKALRNELGVKIAPIIIPVEIALTKLLTGEGQATGTLPGAAPIYGKERVGRRGGDLNGTIKDLIHGILADRVAGADGIASVADSNATSQAEADRVTKAFQARRAGTREGINDQVRLLEGRNAELAIRLRPQSGIGGLAARQDSSEYADNQRRIDSLRVQLKDLKGGTDAEERQITELERRDAARAIHTPVAQAIFRANEDVQKFKSPGNRQIAAQSGAADVRDAALQELRRVSGDAEKTELENSAKSFKLFLSQSHKGVTEETKEVANLKKVLTELGVIDKERITNANAADNSRAEHQARIVSLLAGPGGELEALRASIQLRFEAAAADLKRKAARQDLFDLEKESATYERQVQDAEFKYEEAILEKRKKGVAEFKDAVVHGFDDLISGGGKGGLNILKSFGIGLERQIIGNVAESAYGSIAGDPAKGKAGIIPHAAEGGIFGTLLRGTPFGPQGDPKFNTMDVKATALMINVSADQVKWLKGLASGSIDTGIGAQDISEDGAGGIGDWREWGGGDAEMGHVTAAIKSVISESSKTNDKIPDSDIAQFLGLGPSSKGPSYSGLSGLLGGLSHAGDLRSVFTGVGAHETLSNSERFGAGIGTAGLVAGGGIAAYDQFRHGDARGAVGGVGALAGTASSLVALSGASGPLAPILAGVGIGLGFVSALLGDPKKNRADQINSELTHGQFIAPISLNTTQGSGGNYVDFDRYGKLRESNFRAVPEVLEPYLHKRSGQYVDVPGGVVSPYGGPTGQQTVIINNSGPQFHAPVQAMDAQSFHEFAQKHSAAIGDATATHLQRSESGRLQGAIRGSL